MPQCVTQTAVDSMVKYTLNITSSSLMLQFILLSTAVQLASLWKKTECWSSFISAMKSIERLLTCSRMYCQHDALSSTDIQNFCC